MTEQNVPDNFTVGSNNLTVSRELLRQAIDVFERIDRWLEVRRGVGWTPQDVEIVIALRAALEQPMQEPVAWMDRDGDVYKELPTPYWCPPHTPLYAAPQAQQPQLLTDEEIDEVWNSLIATPDFSRVKVARAIESAVRKQFGVNDE